MIRFVTTFSMCLCFAVPALAQSTSVGASFVGNIVRSGSVESDQGLSLLTSTDGESIGVSLSVAQALGERWGVEVEFVRPGEVERENVEDLGAVLSPPTIFRPIEYRVRYRQRHTTIGTTVWFRQAVGGRTSLVYLGGVSFARVRRESEIELVTRALLPGQFLPVVPPRTTSVVYSAGPMVGFEARIALTSRAFFIPGIRLHDVGAFAGWLLRPGIGVQWEF